jgi:two-component system chemotaxis response regulator CheY
VKTIRSINFLVVEDNSATLESLSAYLRCKGHTVVPAGNGLGAEVCMAAFRPDAIIIDHVMPALDGLGFIKNLRSDRKWKTVPVVLITALASGPEMKELEDAIKLLQPVRLLRKPFDPPALLDALRQMPRADGGRGGEYDFGPEERRDGPDTAGGTGPDSPLGGGPPQG